MSGLLSKKSLGFYAEAPSLNTARGLDAAAQSFWVSNADITEVAETMTATARKPMEMVDG